MILRRATKGEIQLMGHVIANYPSPKAARQMIEVMVKAGVRVIEIQIPFSEPMADGPLFMQANQAAIEQGVRVADCFELMAEVSKAYQQVVFLFMTYANIAFKYGFAEFVEKAKACGAQGAIVPDLPVDASAEYETACRKHGFLNVLVIPPNIGDERLKLLCKKAQGLIYAVARKGVTGDHTEFGRDLDSFIKRIRSHTELPVAVGFGVRTPEDVGFLNGRADFAVVGSAALEIFTAEGIEGARKFWQALV